jgi:hypothetical protein
MKRSGLWEIVTQLRLRRKSAVFYRFVGRIRIVDANAGADQNFDMVTV